MSLARKQSYRIQYTGNLWLFCLPLLLKSLLPLKQLVCFSLFHLCHHLSLCSRPSLTRLQLTTQFGAWHPLGSICQFSWHTATTWMLAVPKPACSSHRIQNPPVTTLSVPWRKCPLFRGVCRVHIVFTVPPHSSPSNPTMLPHQCSDCITLLAASPWLTAFPLLKSLPTHPYLNSPLSSSSLLLWSGFPNNLGSCFFLLTVLLPRLMDVCSVDLWKFLRPFGEGGMSWGHTHSYNNTKMWFVFSPCVHIGNDGCASESASCLCTADLLAQCSRGTQMFESSVCSSPPPTHGKKRSHFTSECSWWSRDNSELYENLTLEDRAF